MGSKTLLQQNSSVLNWGCHRIQVVPHNGRKTAVAVVVVNLDQSVKQLICFICVRVREGVAAFRPVI